jgi:hypothetical protein
MEFFISKGQFLGTMTIIKYIFILLFNNLNLRFRKILFFLNKIIQFYCIFIDYKFI